MVEELDVLTRSIARDRSLRAVVLTGAREGVFVTHYEIGEILAGAEGLGPPPPRAAAAAAVRLAGAIRHTPVARGLVERTSLRGLLELHRVHDLFRRMNRSGKSSSQPSTVRRRAEAASSLSPATSATWPTTATCGSGCPR